MSYTKNDSEEIKRRARQREVDCLPVIYQKQLEELTQQFVFEQRENAARHNPYDQEIREQTAIEHGDVEALEKAILETYQGDIGRLDDKDTLRSVKDLCIVVITLACRSAIRGGVPAELAFSMSDIYINAVEHTQGEESVTRIARGAEYRYCRLVNEYRGQPGKTTGTAPDPQCRHQNSASPANRPPEDIAASYGAAPGAFTASSPTQEHVEHAKDYIFHHLHEKITVEEIAQALALNPRYLSSIFHKATGRTISQYIMHEKIRLVKNLLIYSQYSYLEIANYLGFSSQSHMGEQFRKETGLTPGEYRSRYRQRNF